MNGQQLAIVVVLILPVNNFPVYYVHITKEERKRKKKKKKRKTRGSEIDNKDLFWPNTLGREVFADFAPHWLRKTIEVTQKELRKIKEIL